MRPIVPLISLVLLSACAAPPISVPGGGPGVPRVSVPGVSSFSKIRAPEGSQAALALTGRGAQVFRCERDERGWFWAFRQPEAELLDANGRVVGRHGANFSFEHQDGSRLVGQVAAFEEAPSSADLRWLLINTRSYGKGSFEGVTQVQRINTRGGMPPASCDAAQANQLLRADFSAEFVFFRPAAR
ncbi:MAG TPA: DUF3455 domain-containing protein [Burkholderiaceae bacterium]|nr:DUF3455 domain-containing protein [Burkholderiaceae bacterium]